MLYELDGGTQERTRHGGKIVYSEINNTRNSLYTLFYLETPINTLSSPDLVWQKN